MIENRQSIKVVYLSLVKSTKVDKTASDYSGPGSLIRSLRFPMIRYEKLPSKSTIIKGGLFILVKSAKENKTTSDSK